MASGLGNGPSAASSRTEAEYRSKVEAAGGLGARTEEELALFEFKRQRAFRVLQAVGARAHFYRSDFRPSVPEYFDVGEVPLLDAIFRAHPDITHVVHLADPYHGAAFDRSGGDGGGRTMAVPRTKEDTRSGMIEALFEQLKKVGDERGADAVPHLVYASSSEVYYHLSDYDGNPNPPPFREDRNVTVPSSLRGAAKLLDEVLATTYHRYHGLHSVGLRLFPVYGPWGLPGTPLFEMAERAVSDRDSPVLPPDRADDVMDYVHVDDAVDAIMAAMQFRPPPDAGGEVPNLVINVGTGAGSTLREAATIMERHFPRSDAAREREAADKAGKGGDDDDNGGGGPARPAVSYASTDRAEALLGFRARVPLEDGLADLLAWHYDRAFPYGGRPAADSEPARDRPSGGGGGGGGGGRRYGESYVASRGIVSCSPLDRECLRGAPVFPCASECSHPDRCSPSFLDDAVLMSRSVTAGCVDVMYTVAMEDGVEGIPSASVAISPDSEPSVAGGDGGGRCNVAFVSERSPLVRRLKRGAGLAPHTPVAEEFLRRLQDDGRRGGSRGGGGGGGVGELLLGHGFWTLIPVATPPPGTADGDWHAVRLLPKLSPGSLFSGRAERAVYCDPDVAFASVPEVLRMARMQPLKDGTRGATAMMVGDGLADGERRRRRRGGARGGGVGDEDGDPDGVPPDRAQAEALQQRAYNMIRVGLRGEMLGGAALPLPDASWAVHALGIEDARLFRCDAYGEVTQWDVGSDERSVEFVMGLHDLWSRVIVTWGGEEPWWTGGGVRVGPEEGGAGGDAGRTRRRRLTAPWEPASLGPGAAIAGGGRGAADAAAEHYDPEAFWRDVAEGGRGRRLAAEEPRAARGTANKGGTADADEEEKERGNAGSWMGVLSSTEVHYFVHIVPSSAIGAVHLEDYSY